MTTRIPARAGGLLAAVAFAAAAAPAGGCNRERKQAQALAAELSKCGNGVIDPGELCDPPNPTNCDPKCGTTCAACEKEKCVPSFAGCHLYAGGQRDLCLAVLECMRKHHCVGPDGDANRCYCGGADVKACLTGRADGPCRAAFEAACLVEPGDPKLECPFRFVNPEFPIGGAVNLVGCHANSCRSRCPL